MCYLIIRILSLVCGRRLVVCWVSELVNSLVVRAMSQGRIKVELVMLVAGWFQGQGGLRHPWHQTRKKIVIMKKTMPMHKNKNSYT